MLSSHDVLNKIKTFLSNVLNSINLINQAKKGVDNLAHLDLSVINTELPHVEDAKRMGLFIAAVIKKSAQLEEDGKWEESVKFITESSTLVGLWVEKAHKLNLSDLLKDPFFDLRNQTRAFAVKWDLDPVFKKEMNL